MLQLQKAEFVLFFIARPWGKHGEMLLQGLGLACALHGIGRLQPTITSPPPSMQVRLASRRAFAAHVRSRFLSTCAAVYVLVLAYTALVTRAPAGTYTHKQHAQRVAPALLGPPAAWLLYCFLNRGFRLLDALTERRLKSMETKLLGMITELKVGREVDQGWGPRIFTWFFRELGERGPGS